jgi:hypothetical protein
MIITVDNYLAGKVITAEKVKITMEQLWCALHYEARDFLSDMSVF